MPAQLHISRMPAREALKRPGSEGSVESVAKRDTRVAPIRAERVAQAILVIAALQAPGPRIGRVTVQLGGRVCAWQAGGPRHRSVLAGQHEHRNLSRGLGLGFAELRILGEQLRPQLGAGGVIELLC